MMNKVFGTKKKKEEVTNPNAPSLKETSDNMDQRGKSIQVKIDEANKQLADVKEQMKSAKG